MLSKKKSKKKPTKKRAERAQEKAALILIPPRRTRKKDEVLMRIDFVHKLHYPVDPIEEWLSDSLPQFYRQQKSGDWPQLNYAKAKDSLLKLFERYSQARRKRGPRFDHRITAGVDVFLDALKKAKMTYKAYRGLSTKGREKFWCEHIWKTRTDEILGVNHGLQGEKLRDEKKRIQDRVWRGIISRRHKRINPPPK